MKLLNLMGLWTGRTEETQPLRWGTNCGQSCSPRLTGDWPALGTTEGGQSGSVTLAGCNPSRKMERICSPPMGWGRALPSSQAMPWEELVLLPAFPSPLLPLEDSSAPSYPLCLLINLLLSNKAVDTVRPDLARQHTQPTSSHFLLVREDGIAVCLTW